MEPSMWCWESEWRQLQAVEISALAKAVKHEGRAGVLRVLDDAVDCF